MKKHIARIARHSLVAVALAAVPGASRAQDNPATNAPVIIAPPVFAPSPKDHILPFRGKVGSIDAGNTNFMVDTITINVTPGTRIMVDGKPGKFSDVTLGESVIGAYKTDSGGNLIATTLRLGDNNPINKVKAVEDQPAVVPNGD